MTQDPSFTLGIEEEYFLVDPESRDIVRDPPTGMMAALSAALGPSVGPEFLRCQIEIGTPVCRTVAEAREELIRLRKAVSEAAAQHGFAIIAASTHPFASWKTQITTDKDRYRQLAADLGTPARRLMTCAMHVHAGIEDEDLRIDLMSQIRYFLPHLLALSASSPFWEGEQTELRSYRLAVFDEMPRTGLPEDFESFAEYRRHVETLVRTGVIEDATKIWWDIRPSDRFPTLEMRITDICTRVADGVALAAFYLCLLRMLWRLRRGNVRWRRYKRMLIAENRWRAMRYGVSGGMIDFGRSEMRSYPELLEEALEMVAEDAEAMGCAAEIAAVRRIALEGASADRQLRVYASALAGGADHRSALNTVVDHLIAETMEGVADAKPRGMLGALFDGLRRP